MRNMLLLQCFVLKRHKVGLGYISSKNEGRELEEFFANVTDSKHHSKQARHAAREQLKMGSLAVKQASDEAS